MFSFSDSSPSNDVLVTGVGLVSPLGCSADVTWRCLLNGDAAGRRLSADDVDHFRQLSQIPGLSLNGAPVDHSEVATRMVALPILQSFAPEITDAWASEPLVAMSLVALHEAMTQARWAPTGNLANRTAVVFGSSKGGLRTAERLFKNGAGRLQSSVRPPVSNRSSGSTTVMKHADPKEEAQLGNLWDHAFQSDSATRAIARITAASAGISCPVAACATGLIAVLQGAAMIHAGLCDVCITGSADAGLRASVLSSFHRLRVTSRGTDGAAACRPFDTDRDGFLVGEGAGVMILESRRHAESRGIQGIAKVRGGGWLSDPTGMTQIDVTGSVVAELLRRTGCADSLRPEVICLHGTGTESNDLAEARGIQQALNAPALPCFGVKGAMGHLLGAAGSVETALTVLLLQHQQIPGTRNLKDQDPRCQISLNAMPIVGPSIQRAAKLSLGFGGHVACGIFERT